MWLGSVSNLGQQEGDARGSRGHRGEEGTPEHTPQDFWAFALHGAGLRDVGSSVANLPAISVLIE